MGDKSLCFKGLKGPVERVSCEDSQELILILNEMTGMNFRDL